MAIKALAVASDIRTLGLSCCFLRFTARLHPDFSTTISPVGSIVAVRLVLHLFLLLPLVNNHVRLLFMRLAIYYTVILDVWPCTLWCAGLYSTAKGDVFPR